jgi:hypothetical protein
MKIILNINYFIIRFFMTVSKDNYFIISQEKIKFFKKIHKNLDNILIMILNSQRI